MFYIRGSWHTIHIKSDTSMSWGFCIFPDNARLFHIVVFWSGDYKPLNSVYLSIWRQAVFNSAKAQFCFIFWLVSELLGLFPPTHEFFARHTMDPPTGVHLVTQESSHCRYGLNEHRQHGVSTVSISSVHLTRPWHAAPVHQTSVPTAPCLPDQVNASRPPKLCRFLTCHWAQMHKGSHGRVYSTEHMAPLTAVRCRLFLSTVLASACLWTQLHL